MLVVFYIIVAKGCNKVRVVCLVGIKVKLAAALTTFFHAEANEVFKQGSLIII